MGRIDSAHVVPVSGPPQGATVWGDLSTAIATERPSATNLPRTSVIQHRDSQMLASGPEDGIMPQIWVIKRSDSASRSWFERKDSEYFECHFHSCPSRPGPQATVTHVSRFKILMGGDQILTHNKR